MGWVMNQLYKDHKKESDRQNIMLAVIVLLLAGFITLIADF